MHDYIHDVTDYGAKGDGSANDTGAVQAAIDACAKRGGIVVFPSGVFATGTTFLESNVTVHLSPGAVWKGYPDESLYPEIPVARASRMDIKPGCAFVYAANAENIRIEGEGLFWPHGEYEAFQGHVPRRPFGVFFVGCRDVALRNISMKNSATWMVRLFACDGVKISGITLWNHCNLNNDGLDIDGCSNVLVSDCWIDATDDALCFKSEGADICEDVVVSNCVLSSHASAFKLGTASIGGFRRFTATGCTVRRSRAEKMIHPLEAWGGLVAIDLGNVDGGIMEDINVGNFTIDGVESPIFVRLGERNSRSTRHGEWSDGPPVTVGHTKRVMIHDIVAVNSGPYPSIIAGYPGHRIEDVTLRNVSITAGTPGSADNITNPVPEKSDAYPINRMFRCNLPAHGLYLRHVSSCTLDGVTLRPADGEPRPAIATEDTPGLRQVNVVTDPVT